MINSPIEITNQAFVLAKAFSIQRSKKNLSFLFNPKTIKNTRWWNVFVGIVEKFGNNEQWHAEEFCEFCFDNYDIKFPHEMSRFSIWKDYMSRKENLLSMEKEITLEMLTSFKAIKHWYEKNKVEFHSFREYIDNTPLWFVKISPYLISCSKLMKSELTKIDEEDIIKKVRDSERFVRTMHVFTKLKTILPEEIG
jgi:hypothetical protein